MVSWNGTCGHILRLGVVQHTYTPGGLVYGWPLCTSCTGALLSVAGSASVADTLHMPANEETHRAST